MEIPLLNLLDWFEANVEKTPTLAVVRRVVQGFFLLLPTSQVKDLGKEWEGIESLRKELGDRYFEEYVACQCEGYKQTRNETGEGFYVAYLVGPTSMYNVEKYGMKMQNGGFHAMQSEIFRNCHSTECDILKEYFRLFMLDKNPDYMEVRRSFAASASPLWVYHSFSQEGAKEMGDVIYNLWTSGKTRVVSKKLGVDKAEAQRAAIKALIFTAQQFNPMARNFTVVPDCEEYLPPLQVAFQFYERKNEIIRDAPPFSVTLDTQKVYGSN